MALVNNFFEIRSDAFKMVVHFRRPIPTRTDSIGPWLDTLTFLTWLAAFINAALVYLFSPESQRLLTSSATLVNLRGKPAQDSSEVTESLDGGMDAMIFVSWKSSLTCVRVCRRESSP
jgi:hypothetical protein